MAPKSYKLHYYNAKGRAEVLRLIMVAGGIPYEEVVITEESWKTEKAKMPFGQVPVLEIDGQRYAQTIALAGYLANEAGLYGKNNLDALKIDQVVYLAADLLLIAVKAFTEKDEIKKAELMKCFAEEDAPRFFKLYEKLLAESGTGYFVGDSPTLADFFVYDQLFSKAVYKTFTTDGYPLLQAHKEKVESIEKIKAYLAARPDTPF